jgi:hypothetical protein
MKSRYLGTPGWLLIGWRRRFKLLIWVYNKLCINFMRSLPYLIILALLIFKRI